MRHLLLILLSLNYAIGLWAQIQMPMILRSSRPADYFEESYPIGNGRLGAVIYGNPDKDILQLNDITFWSGMPETNDRDTTAYYYLKDIRKALFAENYALADSLQLHLQGANSAWYLPLGTLCMENPRHLQHSDYKRLLDIDSAIVSVTYKQGGISYRQEYLASAPDQAIVISISADKGASINRSFRLTSPVAHDVKVLNDQIIMTGHAPGDPKKSIHFCTILRVHHTGGILSATDSTLQVSNADKLLVTICNETSFNGFDQNPVTQGRDHLNEVKKKADFIAKIDYQTLRERHIRDYKNLYDRFQINLNRISKTDQRDTEDMLKAYTLKSENNSYLETLYLQYGRYMLISSSRTNGVPANLQGLWNPHLKAPWRSNYTTNINLEQNYWPAALTGLSEMLAPLASFAAALSHNGKFTARHYYGITAGWCASHNSDIWAMTHPVGEKRESPEWANWNMGGAWIVNTLWENHLFDPQSDYLRHTLYPLMKGASDFMLAWIVPDPHNPKEYITAPSTSPENEYVIDNGYHGTTCYGSTADLAIIRELFVNTVKAASMLNKDPEYRKKLRHTTQKLRNYAIGKDGDLNEWYHDWRDYDPHHRHLSHLIGLYPGTHITPQKTPILAAAAQKSLDFRGNGTTGWSTAWHINLRARLQQGKQAYEAYRRLLTYVSPDGHRTADRSTSTSGTYPNLMDAHPPFQIDGNLGAVAGICEMLVQSHEEIRLLPALPEAWPEGRIRGIRARGGFIIDMDWKKGKVIWARITSKYGKDIHVFFNGHKKLVRLRKGKSRIIK